VTDSARQRSEGYLFMVVVATGIGVAGAGGAVVFRVLIRFFQGAFFGGLEGIGEVIDAGFFAEPRDPSDWSERIPAWRLWIAPALGGLIVGPLVWFFAREARGPGVPEVMEAVALRGGAIRRRVVGIKTLVSAISIGSGGSVGREGPIVQIGAAVASWAGDLLRVPPRQRRTMVGCGAAAGIAATFNTPIAGALFAVEVIMGDFAVAQFSPIVISSVVATVVSRLMLGNHPAFDVPTYELLSPFELIPYAVLGVACALLAAAFIRGLALAEDGIRATGTPEWLQACLGGAAVGLIGLAFPEVLGVGYSTITQVLEGGIAIGALGGLLVAKLVATVLTVGSGGSGGIFAPSLFLGAAAGALLGGLVDGLLPGFSAGPGAYALVGMGTFVAAATHAPLTAILMIFEMTESIEIIPPLMAACVVATLTVRVLLPDSAYSQKLRRRGVDLERDQDPNVLRALHVRDVADRDPEVMTAGASFDAVMERIVHSEHAAFFVTNDRGELVGAIHLQQVRRLLGEQDELRSLVVAADMTEPAVSLSEDDTLDAAAQLIARTLVTEVAVVSADDPRKLVGSLHQRDLMSAYNQESLRRDLVSGVSNRMSVAGGGRHVDLGGEFVLTEHVAPPRFEGQTLKELDIRRRAGLQVLLIRKLAGDIRVPTPDDRIEAGDRLVVAGPRSAINDIAKL